MKKQFLAFMAAAMLFGSTVFGGDPTLVVIDNKLVKVESVVQPKLTITVPGGNVDLGEILKLEGKVEGEIPAYVKSKKYKWTVTERGYVKQFWEQDNWVIFGTGVKSSVVRVGCEVTLTYQLEKEEVIKKIETTVDIKVGQNPDPTPEPPGPDPKPPGPDPKPPGPDPKPPGPDPKPPGPDPKPPGPDPVPVPPVLTGLAKSAHQWAVEVGPANKAQSAPVIAKALLGVSVRIGHDAALKDAKSILLATKKEINDALTKDGYKPTEWDAWGTKLQDYAYQEYLASRLRTIDEFKMAWADLATGLNAVK